MLSAALGATAAVAAPSALSRAQTFMQRGQYAEALRLLTPLAAANPRDADAHYRLGLAYQRGGNPRQAASAFHRAHLARPKEALYVAALARLYAAAADYDRGSFWYRKLLVLRPANTTLVNEAADFSLQQDRPLDAELILKKSLKQLPRNADGWVLLGQCYEAMKLHAEAARAYERAATFQAPDAENLRQLIALYMQAGQPDRALPYLQMAEQADPQNASLRVQVAECHLAVGNRPAALAAYRRAVQLAPRNATYQLGLAALLGDDDPAAALAAYQAAFALRQPTESQLRAAIALANAAARPDLALDYLSRLVALRPAELAPRESLIQAALKAGDSASAVLQWRELQRAGHDHYASQESELALRLEARDWALGRLRDISAAAAVKPDLAARLATLAVQLGDGALATSLALAALQAVPGDPETALTAARALVDAGEAAQAEPVLRRLHSGQPDSVSTLQALAECELALKRPQAAYDLLAAALRREHYEAASLATLLDAAAALDRFPQAATALVELLRAHPERDDLLDALCQLYRRHGGPQLAARRLVALSQAHPQHGLWAMTAARELLAAGDWREAAVFYERLARGSEYSLAARTGLFQLLLAEQRHVDLLNTLARLTGPQAIGAEAYRLLLAARAELIVKGEDALDLPAIGAALTIIALSSPDSLAYCLALADLYVTVGQGEQGLIALQSQLAAVPAAVSASERRASLTLALARLLRRLNRPREALVWLDQLPPGDLPATALLERAQCLLDRGLCAEAAGLAERVLQTADAVFCPEAHRLAAEAAIIGSRPEEALWHFSRALVCGTPRAVIIPRLVSLCTTQPIAETAVFNAIKELYAQGQTLPALELADALSNRPGYGELRRWAATRIAETLTATP